MKKLILLIFFCIQSISASEITENKIKYYADEAKLDCKSYGNDSCSARFMAMGACTYFIGVNRGKSNKEALKIGDAMFVYMMKSHKIKPQIIFNKNKKIKNNIKQEFIKRIFFCKSEIEKAVPLIYKSNRGEDIEHELLGRLVNAFPYWYVESLEKIFNEKSVN